MSFIFLHNCYQDDIQPRRRQGQPTPRVGPIQTRQVDNFGKIICYTLNEQYEKNNFEIFT